MVRVLIFRPNYETATKYGHAWLGEIAKIAASLGHNVIDLAAANATAANFMQAMNEFKPGIVIAMGHGSCYSEDTEILTEDGWKKFCDLNQTDKVATVKPETMELKYELPLQRQQFLYAGRMLHMDGRRVNLLVTPNHHLYASWMAGGKWGSFRFLEAGKIGEKGVARDPNSGKFKSTGSTMGNLLKFKRGALWNCSSIQTFDVPMCDKQFSNQTGLCSTILVESTGVKIEDWLRFFGVWLAEGSASKGTTLGHYIISIAQNNGEKRSKIKEWVDEVGRQVGFKAWVEESNSHSQAVKFKNKQLFKYLSKFGHAQDKYIPKEIKSLPSNLLRILLDSMVLGDGYVNKHGEIFYSTTSKKLADDVQEIALKLGKGAVITKQKRGGNSAPLYVVGIHQDEVCISKKRLKWMKYVGMVYCVTVSSGLIYVRRHGRPCWCGNSTRFSGQDSQIVLTACTNDQIMSGSQAYMLSCFDDSTEILTYDGFKLFEKITQEDRVATLNVDGFIEYHNPRAIQKYPYKGKLIRWKGKNYDIRVTPDHNMYCRFRHRNQSFEFIKAEELAKKSLPNYEFKRDAKWACQNAEYVTLPLPCVSESRARIIEDYKECLALNKQGLGSRRISKKLGKPRTTIRCWITGKSDPTKFNGIKLENVPVELWLKFLGWYISEGSTKKSVRDARRILISQTKRENKTEIIEIIKTLGFSPHIEDNNIVFTSKQVYEALFSLGKSYQRFVPQWIKDLPPNKLQAFLDSLLKGDGTIKGKGFQYYTVSKKLADDIQEIALKIGYSATIGEDNREFADFGSYISKKRTVYSVYLSKGQSTPSVFNKPIFEDYVGCVYDVTVPNHTIYVRRNGKAVWSGNCLMGQQLAPSMESKGALAVAAYISEFTWCIDPMHSQDPYPVGDTYAKPFMTAVVEACRLLLRGGSWKECYDLSIKLFNDGRDEWHDSPDPIASQIIICLEHDRDSLAIYGLQDISPVGGAIAGGSPIIPFAFGAILLAISMV